MSVLYVLVGASLFVALVFLGFFLWAVRGGQYEDKVTPAVRALFDDAPAAGEGESGMESESNDERSHGTRNSPV
jgi:cbb3-type cytochrome oxidase maturation protein